MTSKAVVLENLRVRFLDHDRLVEVLQRKAFGVMPAVFGFSDVLAEKVMRQMTVDAYGHSMVTRFLPRVILRLHDMAVDANLGIIAHVGQTLCVQERIATDSQPYAGQNCKKHKRFRDSQPGASDLLVPRHAFPRLIRRRV